MRRPLRREGLDVTGSDGTWIRAADGRLRAWLRILVVVLVAIIGTTAASAAAMLFERLAVQHAASYLAAGLVAIGVFVVAARWLDRRSVRSYGLTVDRRWWSDLAAGVGIGVMAPVVVMLVLLAVGVAQIDETWSAGTDQGLWTGLFAAVLVYISIAVWEELIFRGYVITNAVELLAERRRPRHAVVWAVIISSVVFAVGHPAFVTSEAPVLFAVAFFVLIGFVLGFAYAFTGRLGLAIGVHLGFNLTANRLLPLFELPPEADQHSMALRTTLEGPGWLTGEGGLPGLAATILAGLAVLGWARWRYGAIRIHPALTGIDGGHTAPSTTTRQASADSRQAEPHRSHRR